MHKVDSQKKNFIMLSIENNDRFVPFSLVLWNSYKPTKLYHTFNS
jgi:hypothetical protein